MTDVTIPVLDAPIDPNEVVEVIKKQVKPNKSAGPDGLSPGLFKLLPVGWMDSYPYNAVEFCVCKWVLPSGLGVCTIEYVF